MVFDSQFMRILRDELFANLSRKLSRVYDISPSIRYAIFQFILISTYQGFELYILFSKGESVGGVSTYNSLPNKYFLVSFLGISFLSLELA